MKVLKQQDKEKNLQGKTGKDLTDEEKKRIIDDVTRQMHEENSNYKNININPVPDIPIVKLKDDEPNKEEEPKKQEQKDFIPEEVRLKRTGLQIFREEFNHMPDIKKRHTASENPLLPLPGSVALALVTAGVISGPVGWIGAGAVAASSYFLGKPIIRKLTGENKLVKEITEQFNDMPVKDLKTMADYLSEENIIDLKPNAVILKALNKSLRTLANRENEKIEETIEQTATERDKLLAKSVMDKNYVYTPEEEKRLGELKDIIDINQKEAEDNELRSKNAKRGKDRISAMYKGNVKGSRFFNIFNKRNSTTEQYKQPLNEYANAESLKIAAEAMNDLSMAARGQALMEQVGDEHTYTKLGLLRSPFNMRQSPARIVSDQRDNTVRNVGVMALAGASLYRTVTNMNEMADELKNAQDNSKDVEKVNQFAEQFNSKKSDLGQSMDNVSDTDIQGTGNNIVNDTFNRGEVAAMRGNGGTVSHMNEGYVADDQLTQQLGNASAEKANGLLNGGVSDKLRNLGKLVSGEENTTVTQKLQDAVADAHSVTGAGVDHATQFSIHENAMQYNQNHADLYEHLADVTDKAEEMMKLQAPTLGKKIVNLIKPDYIGPIAAALTSIGSTVAVGFKRNLQEKVNTEDIGKEEER